MVIPVKRDNRRSIAYSEELPSSTISVTLQSTDRHHGIVGQGCCHYQLASCTRQTQHPEPGGPHRPFQKQRTSTPSGNGSPRSLPGVVVVGYASRPCLDGALGRSALVRACVSRTGR